MTPKQKQALEFHLAGYQGSLRSGNEKSELVEAIAIDQIASRMHVADDIHHEILMRMLSVCLDEGATPERVSATRLWLKTMGATDTEILEAPRHWRTIL
jgi:hypothetical protein